MRLDWREVFRWRAWNLARSHQFDRSRLHVHVLHAGSIRAAHAEVSLVEEVLDAPADFAIFPDILAQFPDAVHQLQFPKVVVVPAHV